MQDDEDLVRDVLEIALAHAEAPEGVPDVVEGVLEDAAEVDREGFVGRGRIPHAHRLGPARPNRHGIRQASAA